MSFVSKSLLALTCFIRRHPWLTAFILILLFLTVTLEVFLRTIISRLFGLGEAGRAVAGVLHRGVTFLEANPGSRFWLPIFTMIWAPLLGWYLLAWAVVDLFKRTNAVAIAEPQE